MPDPRARPAGMTPVDHGASLDRLIAEAIVLAGGEHQCAVLGHDWKFAGGTNAGCDLGLDDCVCSVPVHECGSCGDCDYGDNDEADQVRARCAEIGPA